MFSGGGLFNTASASNTQSSKGPGDTTPNLLGSITGQGTTGLFGGAGCSLFQPTNKDSATSQTATGTTNSALPAAAGGGAFFGKPASTPLPVGENKGAGSLFSNNTGNLFDNKPTATSSNAGTKNDTASLFNVEDANARSSQLTSGGLGKTRQESENAGKRDSLKLGGSNEPKPGEAETSKGKGDGEGGTKKEELAKSTIASNDIAVAEELALQSKMEEVLQMWERKLARQTEDFKKYSRAVSEMDTLIFQLVDKLVEIQKNQESVQSKQIDLTALVKRVERRQDQMRQNIEEMERRVNAEISDSRIPVGQLETHAHRINSQLQAIEKEVGQISEEMETMQEKAYPEGLGRLLLLINSEKRTLERIRQEIDSFCAPD